MDVRRYENQLKFAVKACLYAVLITPIIVGPKYLYPFVFPKAAVFQALVELALLLYVLLLIIDRSYLPRRNVILWGVVAYVGAIALSNVLAIDRMLAFWSKAERMDGLFQYLHLLVFFFILTGVLKREAEWLGFLKWNMVAGVFVGGAALISKFAPKVLPFGDQDRLGGTFGNPAFLATYYVVLSFFALIFLLREKVPRLKICYALLFLYFLFLLVISGTRGGYIGFLAGVVVFITSLLASDWKRWGKLAIVVVVLGVVLVGTLYAGKGFFSAKSNFVRDRIYHIFELPQARLVSWKIALEAFRAKPILGWGQENYIHAFNAHFDPEIHTYELSLFDRAHNKILDLLVMNGVPGLMAYLFLFAAMAFSMVGAIRRRAVNPVWPAGLFGLVAGYFVQNLVLFEMPTSGIMVFLFAALMNWMVAEMRGQAGKPVGGHASNPVSPQVGRLPFLPQWVAWPVLLFIVLVFLIGVWQPQKASRSVVATVKAMSNPYLSQDEQLQGGLDTYQATRNQHSTYIDREFDIMISRRLRFAQPSASRVVMSSETFRTFMKVVIENLWKDFNRNKVDYDVLMEVANLSFILQSADSSYIPKTIETLELAKKLAPKREDAYQQAAMWYLSVGDSKRADEELDKFLALNDKVGRFWWFRAVYGVGINDPREVDDALATAEKYGFDWGSLLPNVSFLASNFEEKGNLHEARKYYILLTERFSTSSPNIGLSAFEKVLSISQALRDPRPAALLKDVILGLLPNEAQSIEVLAKKYGLE